MCLVPEEDGKKRTKEAVYKCALNILFSYKIDFFGDK